MFRTTKTESSWNTWCFKGIVLVLVITGVSDAMDSAAAELPGLTAISDLELNGHFLFELDGRDLDDAEIYLSEREVAYLVITSELQAPLLISPRGKSVQSVNVDGLTRKGGAAELAEGSVLEYLGEYETLRGEMIFELDGKIAKLKPKPPLLGYQTFEGLEKHDPKYAYNARSLRAAKAAAAVAPPIPGERVKIRVYFESGIDICEMLVPRVKLVEDDWKVHGVRFEYYGLPTPLIDDQHAVDMGILGVPTAIVFVDGEEIGRLKGTELLDPEQALLRVLAQGSE